jgi:hypothetical protein
MQGCQAPLLSLPVPANQGTFRRAALRLSWRAPLLLASNKARYVTDTARCQMEARWMRRWMRSQVDALMLQAWRKDTISSGSIVLSLSHCLTLKVVLLG